MVNSCQNTSVKVKKTIKTSQRHSNVSEAKKWRTVWLETVIWRLFTCEHLLKRQRRRDFCIVLWLGMKNGFITITSLEKHQPNFHGDGQTEYSDLQDTALYLVGPARYSVLWAIKPNNDRRFFSNVLNTIEQNIETQKTDIQKETD